MTKQAAAGGGGGAVLWPAHATVPTFEVQGGSHGVVSTLDAAHVSTDGNTGQVVLTE